MPRLSELQLNGTVLAFGAGLSAVTGLVFGLVPALRATGGDAATAREESRTATAAGLRLRSTLVVAELAIALVLVVGSSLLFNSFLRLSAIDPGFDPHHVVSIQLDTSTIAAGDRAAFEDALINGLRALPGVQAAGASWQLPFSPNGHCCWATQIAADGVPDKTLIAYVHPVTPGYFRALGIPIVDGRLFAPGDMSADQLPKPGPQAPAHVPARMPIIVSRSAADAWWPAGRAVGRVIRLRHNTTAFEVVGVAQSVRQWGLDSEPGIDAYVPLSAVASWNLGRLDIAIRHTGDGANLTSAARDVLAKLEPTLALAGSATMDARVSGSIASPRFDAVLLTTFGVLALLLASAGVYASMRYLVGVRRREMSIRLALGASPRDLVRHVVGHGLVLVCVGSAIGVAASLALSRVLKNLLFQISPTDPLAVTAAVLLMAGAALAACWGPARRAAAADPAATLH